MHMKTPAAYIVLLSAICMISLGGRVKAIDATDGSEPARAKKQSPVMNLLVISAVFGAGTHFIDVTNRVNYLLYKSDDGFFVNPPVFGSDPIPYTRKELVVVYEFKGRRQICTIDETGQVSLDILRSRARKQK